MEELSPNGYTYKYPKLDLTVDAVIFGLDDTQGLQVLLIKRGGSPYKGRWALPGGYVNIDEELDAAVLRELKEETHITGLRLTQIGIFDKVRRDPRGRVVSVAYSTMVWPDQVNFKADDDAADAGWFALKKLPRLAFDHTDIINTAWANLQAGTFTQPIGLDLLPKKFTLSQLQAVYEIVLGKKLDKGTFRKAILGTALLEALQGFDPNMPRRTPLYRFNKKRYATLTKQGFRFEV